MIIGANFLNEKKEEKIKKACESLEAKIKEGIVSEQLHKDYFRELSEKTNRIREVGLSNEDVNYLNKIEQYLYKAQQSNNIRV